MTKILALLLVLVLAVSTIGVWFVYQNVSGQQKGDEFGLVIEGFSASGWGNPAGVTMMTFFNVTIVNNGSSDVDGVLLEIKRSDVESDPFNITKPLGVLHKGETTEITDLVLAINMNLYFEEFYNSSFTAKLKIDNKSLDESIVQITNGQF